MKTYSNWMEYLHVVTVYDSVHKSHNFIKSDHHLLIISVLKLSMSAYSMSACTLVWNHRCTGSRSSRTMAWTA